MAEGTPGPGAEGQPAPLNPQARADIDQALANAGIKGDLNPKATEDVDRVLNQAGVDSFKGPNTNKPNSDKPFQLIQPVEDQSGQAPNQQPEASQNPWNNMPYKEMHVKDEPPAQGFVNGPISGAYKMRGEDTGTYIPRPDQPPEFSDSRSAVGVTVRRVRAQGLRIMSENEPMGVQHQYDGLVVDMPDGRRIAVVRGTLSGATAETYPPSELPHLIDATVRMQKLEREELKQKIAETGGRDKYLMQEAQRLVKEGKYPNLEMARGVVLMQTEVYPTYPQTEVAIERAVNTGELPQDITDPEEIAKIRDELDLSARYGLIDDFANKLPGLMRANTGNPVDKARFAFNLAKALTETMLGENNGIGNSGTSGISFENAAQLSQMELDATKFSHFRPEYIQAVVDVLNYTWDKVSRIQQTAGVTFGKPRFRIV